MNIRTKTVNRIKAFAQDVIFRAKHSYSIKALELCRAFGVSSHTFYSMIKLGYISRENNEILVRVRDITYKDAKKIAELNNQTAMQVNKKDTSCDNEVDIPMLREKLVNRVANKRLHILSDKTLVQELRNRGYEVTAEKTKVIKL